MTTKRESRISGRLPDPGDQRNPFRIDRDRVLYSLAFRRLAGVTQVVSPREGEIFHNRLTHSLKVAQIARRFAENLDVKYPEAIRAWGGVDPDVVETAALAHDLGHPPFGHIAEHELDNLVSTELCEDGGVDATAERREGYEGNAQSFRIVTALAVRGTPSQHGLDLTLASLDATLKYPWQWQGHPDKPNKYGYYLCDRKAFEFAHPRFSAKAKSKRFARSLEAQIMDWSDDIAYSIHDTEDFYRAGLIPLDRLNTNAGERARFHDSVLARAEARGKPITADRAFDKVFNGLFGGFTITEPYEGTREQQEFLQKFVSFNITKFVNDTKIVEPPGENGEGLDYSPETSTEIFLLKELIWTYVIENPSLAAHQLGQRRAIQRLFEEYNHAARSREWQLLPPFYRERAIDLYERNRTQGDIPCAERVRLVSDTISSMTDRQAMLVYQQFTGMSATSMLDPVVR